jgi:hypothetical protein
MRLKLIILGALVASAPAGAQVELKNPASEIYNKCLAEAIAANEVRAGNGQTFYTCFGDTAQSWYGISTDERVVRDKNGIFIARYFGETGYCAHQIEDAATKPVSTFICEIVVGQPR